jgi:hypothetical protein
MNIKNLIPIDFSRNITRAVSGDVIWNNYMKLEFILTEDSAALANSGDADGVFYVVSFADRPNIGKQPVASGGFIKAYYDGDWHSEVSDLCDWDVDESDSKYVITKWKPNHASTLKQWQAEQGAKPMEPDWIHGSEYYKPSTKEFFRMPQSGYYADYWSGFRQRWEKSATPVKKLDGSEFVKRVEWPSCDSQENMGPGVEHAKSQKLSSNEIELKRLVDFVWSNKLIEDGENPVDCAIRELAEKHNIDLRTNEEKIHDEITAIWESSADKWQTIDRIIASDKLIIKAKG